MNKHQKKIETIYVALLRGINVGGKNKLPMSDLVAMFAKAGCSNVRNYIQSGNIVFRAGTKLAERIPALITASIADRFGYQIPVILRTADELREVCLSNPFLKTGADIERLHVVFLADQPGKANVAALDPNRSPPDAFIVRGREIFLRLPNGAARTKLTNGYFDSVLATISTMRNWKTVLKLFEMTQD